jgi:hypothetical protein
LFSLYSFLKGHLDATKYIHLFLCVEPGNTRWTTHLHILVMLMFLVPSADQMSIINESKGRKLQVHHRDGIRFYNDFSNLEIVSTKQNTTMAHGMVVCAFYADSGNYFECYDSKKSVAVYFGKVYTTIDYYLNSITCPPDERKTVTKNNITFYLII